MYVFGHRRSGNHLLIEYLKRVFNEPGIKRHIINKNKELLNGIYIFRDGKDVLASCYEWWRNSGESRVCKIQPSFENITFNEYLRGVDVPFYIHRPPGNVHPYEIQDGLLADPIGFWANHVLTYYRLGLPFVEYEKLISDPGTIMARIADRYRIKFQNPPEKITDLVGCHPRKGVSGDHMNYFNKDDLELFNEKTKEVTKEKLYDAFI